MNYLMKMTRHLLRYTRILLAFLGLFSLDANAQKYTLADSAKAKALLQEAHDSVISNPKASLAIAQKLLDLSQAIDYKTGIAAGFISKGYAYFQMGDVENSLKYDLEGLNYSKQNNLPRLEAGGYNRLGALYVGIGALDKAFESYESELQIRQALNDSIYMADCYLNLGILLHKQNLFDEAIINYEKAIQIYHALKSPEYEAYVLRAISDIYLHQKQYPKALNYILRSFNLKKSAEIYSSFGDYYNYRRNYDSALYNYNISLKMFIADSDRLDIARIMGNIGEIEIERKKYKETEPYLKQSLDLVLKLADIEEIGNRQNSLAKLYTEKGDFKNACQYYIAAMKAKDSFNKSDTRTKLAESGTRFRVKEVEDKNKLLQKNNDLQQLKLQRKNILIGWTISALVAFLTIGLLIIRQIRLKAYQQKAELEQKQLRAQMNPHFIFNCLNSIQHFVVINDVKNANKYLTGFASLMRQTLENSKEGMIALHKEITYLENYLDLEMMRFKDKFTTQIICDGNIDTNALKIPSMVIQPFIENAIRHGLSYLKESPGRLIIKFYLEGGNLFCTIDDNGIGRMQSQKLKESASITYESQGMELTRQRLALVSKTSGADYKIEIIDKKGAHDEPEGTTIIIKFPMES